MNKKEGEDFFWGKCSVCGEFYLFRLIATIQINNVKREHHWLNCSQLWSMCNLGQGIMGIASLWRVISQKGWEPSQGTFQIWSNFCFFFFLLIRFASSETKSFGNTCSTVVGSSSLKRSYLYACQLDTALSRFSCSDSGAHENAAATVPKRANINDAILRN